MHEEEEEQARKSIQFRITAAAITVQAYLRACLGTTLLELSKQMFYFYFCAVVYVLPEEKLGLQMLLWAESTETFSGRKKNIQETALGFWINLIFFPNLTQIHNRALPEWSLIFQLMDHLKKNDMKVAWIELSNYKYNITYLM